MTATESKPEAVAELVIPEYLQTLLEQVATKEGFVDYKIATQPGSNFGDGFQGIMLGVVISGERNGIEDRLVLICKIPPLNEIRRKTCAPSFQREIKAYDEYLPEMVEFQREKGVTDSEGFFSFPKCYGTYSNDETLEYALILEDLRESGYRMWDKFKQIDFKHVRLATKEIGKFHAMSYAFREQKPELFEKFTKVGMSMYRTISDYGTVDSMFHKVFDRAIDALRPEDTEEKRKMTYLRNNFLEKMRVSSSSEKAEPYAVLCHGDCWNNNMMFQYSSADSLEPQKAILIDWQINQYSSPVTDLSYFMYSGLEQPLRSAHFDDILHSYHDNLAALLNRLGGDASKQFSFDELYNQLNTFGIYGLLMAPMLMQVITVKAEDLPDLDSITEENAEDFDFMANGVADGYSVRISDCIRDFIGRGFFGDQHLVEEVK